MAFKKEQSYKCSRMAALLSALILDCLFPGLAGGRDPLRGPSCFIESKAGSLEDGIVPNARRGRPADRCGLGRTL